MNGYKGRHTACFRILMPDKMSRPFWGHHEHIDRCIRDYLAEVDIKPMSKGDVCPFTQIRANLFPVQITLQLVRNKYHNNIRDPYSLADRQHLKTCTLCLLP